MRVEVIEEPITALKEYARLPIAFEVGLVLDVADVKNCLGEFVLTERRLDVSYIKYYPAALAEIS